MKAFGRLVIVFLALLLGSVSQFAQEDLGRSELPLRIGGNSCSGLAPGSNATIFGSLNVNGMTNSEKQPKLSVALYAGGMYVSRQRVKNGGSFSFYCVPRESVMLTAEIDMVEVGNFSMGQLVGPPQTNRQDIVVIWSDAGEALKRRNEVISARNAYKRTDENQKLFEKAMDGLNSGKGENSAKILEKLLERDPNDFVAWSELGRIRFNNNRFDEADAAFSKARDLKQDFLPASLGAGRASIALKNFDRAIEILSKANEINPGSADINHYLGEAYLQVRKGSLAIIHLRKAIEIAPAEKADLHLRLAALFNAAGAKHLAAEECRLLLEKKPDHPDKEKLQKYIRENGQ